MMFLEDTVGVFRQSWLFKRQISSDHWCCWTPLFALHKTPGPRSLNFNPHLSPQGLSSLSDPPPPPPPPPPAQRWVIAKDTSHLTEVRPITSATTREPLSHSLPHTHPLTSDLCVYTPEHLILLSQAFARFSSLHLLRFLFFSSFPFSSFSRFFI